MVSIFGYSSDPSSLSYGVAQGSVLGPILFLLHTQSLSQIIHSQFTTVNIADYSQLYNSVPYEHLHSLISNLHSCVAVVFLYPEQFAPGSHAKL